jgi:pimeloyl-ACP methyl ester carboxylesterase
MADVPFRIKISLIVLGILAAVVVVGPLLVPVPALTGTVAPADLAYPDSLFVDLAVPGGMPLRVHVQTVPSGLAPEAAADAGAAAPNATDASAAARSAANAGPAARSAAPSAPAVASPGGVDGFVLLHGFGSQTMTWRHLQGALGDEATPALAFDRPAFGLTARPLAGDWGRGANPYAPETQVALTLALMDAYGLGRAVLIGHSAGGAIALEAALAHPERIAGLVLVSPAVVRGGGAPAWSRPLLHTPQMARVGPLTMRQLAGQPGEDFLRSAYADPTRLDPTDVDAYRRATRVHDWDRALWELVKASREPRFAGRLEGLDRPVLVVSGAEDRVVPLAQSEEVARSLAHATLVALPGCGHVAHEECPDETIEAVLAWLEREFPGWR